MEIIHNGKDRRSHTTESSTTQQKFGYPIMSLSFPVALLIEHVYVLPFNSKPAALLYTTNHYSISDTFKFGITMVIISWLLIIIWGEAIVTGKQKNN